MDIDRAIKAPFSDAAWLQKSLWAALWTGLFVTSPAVLGYRLDYIRNVANGYETPLPEWNKEFGRWWVRGFLVALALFIYSLPAIVLMLVGSIPLIVAAIAAGGNSGSSAIGALAVAGGGTICLTLIVSILYLIAVSIFFSAAQVNFAFTDDFGALFRFKEITTRLRTEGAGYFGAWGMSILISFAAGVVSGIAGTLVSTMLQFTIVLAVLSPLASGFVGGFVGFLAGLMTAHLFGQYAAKTYGLAGLQPVSAAPAGYVATYPPAPPVPPAPPAPPTPPTSSTPPAPPAPPVPPTPPQAPDAPLNPAPSVHSEPESPTPSHPSGETAPPANPESDPPAEGGGD
jgi:hypothetical protein